jgi:membrane fusion protein (multidrug efflux system)
MPDTPLEMPIRRVVPVSDPSARTFLIRIDADQADLRLTPGMSAGGHLLLSSGETALVVSRDAVLRHPDGRVTAWVLDEAGDTSPVSERLLQTGLTFDGLVVIENGLELDTRIVIEGNEGLQAGQVVTVRGSR